MVGVNPAFYGQEGVVSEFYTGAEGSATTDENVVTDCDGFGVEHQVIFAGFDGVGVESDPVSNDDAIADVEQAAIGNF